MGEGGQAERVEQSAAEMAAAELQAVIGSVRDGTLRMFGDWFGRPYDNVHVARSAHAEGEDLVVRFDQDEQLRVSSPGDWEFNSLRFRIGRARWVQWSWFYYGRAHTRDNWFTITHWLDDHGVVHASADVDWYTPVFAPDASQPAAQLV